VICNKYQNSQGSTFHLSTVRFFDSDYFPLQDRIVRFDNHYQAKIAISDYKKTDLDEEIISIPNINYTNYILNTPPACGGVYFPEGLQYVKKRIILLISAKLFKRHKTKYHF